MSKHLDKRHKMKLLSSIWLILVLHIFLIACESDDDQPVIIVPASFTGSMVHPEDGSVTEWNTSTVRAFRTSANEVIIEATHPNGDKVAVILEDFLTTEYIFHSLSDNVSIYVPCEDHEFCASNNSLDQTGLVQTGNVVLATYDTQRMRISGEISYMEWYVGANDAFESLYATMSAGIFENVPITEIDSYIFNWRDADVAATIQGSSRTFPSRTSFLDMTQLRLTRRFDNTRMVIELQKPFEIGSYDLPSDKVSIAVLEDAEEIQIEQNLTTGNVTITDLGCPGAMSGTFNGTYTNFAGEVVVISAGTFVLAQ